MAIRKTKPRRKTRPGTADEAVSEENSLLGLTDFERVRLDLSMKHEGQWVAWAPTRDRILVAGRSFDDVDAEVQRLGFDVESAIFEWIEPRQLGLRPDSPL